ncbi:hypothetical protein TPY_3205 [Sulfobacillus acidophilus TPY]|nr:hypothetical protein TPY_3205 [Sulfobacillus acidophilus TPY]
MLDKPPALDTDMGGLPALADPSTTGTPAPASEPTAGSRWTPEVVKILMAGLFNAAAAWRGPHWAWIDEEGDPLIEPTAQVFNMTPGLKDLAPEHMAIAVVVAGYGTMVAKRLAWDAQLRAAQKPERPPAPQESPGAGGSPYGPNRLA